METAHTGDDWFVVTKGVWHQQVTFTHVCLALYRCPPRFQFEQVCLPPELKIVWGDCCSAAHCTMRILPNVQAPETNVKLIMMNYERGSAAGIVHYSE